MEPPEDREPLADPPDWELLASLFGPGNYRHRMGLRRSEIGEFYAATPMGGILRREKQMILRRHERRHTLVTPEGHHAASEFAKMLGLSPGDQEDPQAFNPRLGLALEPDLLFVQPPDWSLVWASVCFPSRWSLEGKARRPLAWIHDAVPGLNAELGRKIGTFFARLPSGEGWRRANWGLSASTLRNQHPDETIPPPTAETAGAQIFIRVEDQHLLKLPRTGAIAFGIRIASFSWDAVMQDTAIAAGVQEKLRTMPSEVVRYKAVEAVLPSLTEESP